MDFDRRNFCDGLSELKRLLRNSVAVAVDFEMSGMDSEGRSIEKLDRAVDHYEKLLKSKGFIVIQFGVCPILLTDKGYEVHPQNYHVIPHPFEGKDTVFKLSARSIEFLLEHGFDFATNFKYGLPFLSKEDERKARNKRAKKKAALLETDAYDARADSTDWSETIEVSVRAAIDSIVTGDSDMQELSLDSFQAKKIVEQWIRSEHHGVIRVEVDRTNPWKPKLVLVKTTPEEVSALEKADDDKFENTIWEAIGARHIMEAIIDSKVPWIGHNCLMDLTMAYKQFVAPLPGTYEEFKAGVHRALPMIYDTKTMAELHPGIKKLARKSWLGKLYESVQVEEFKTDVHVPAVYEKYMGDSLAHEAGYDAFMTAIAFIKMAHFVSDDCLQDGVIIIPEFLNRLKIMHSLAVINFGGQDEFVDEDDAFYVYWGDQVVNNSDIVDIFSELTSVRNVRIDWLTDNSCYVLVKDESARAVLNRPFPGLRTSGIFEITTVAEARNAGLFSTGLPKPERAPGCSIV